MALSPVIFKFSEINILNYLTEDVIGHVTVAGQANFSFSPELAEQMSGPSNFPIETEVSTIGTEGSITFRNYEPKVLEILMGAATTDNTMIPDAGQVTEVREFGSVPIIAASGTGAILSGIDPKTGDDDKVKAGVYRFEIVGDAGEWELKSIGSVDLTRNDFASEEDFTARIVARGTLPITGDQDNKKLDFGASGVEAQVLAAFTAQAADNKGRTLTFRVIPPGRRFFTSSIGQEGLVIPKVKIRTLSRRVSDGRWGEFYAFNAIFPGLNVAFGDDFSENEISGKLIYDSTARKVADFSYYQL